MAKFIKFFTALLLVFLLVNFLYLTLLPKIDWDFGKTREAYRFKNKQLKVLVFGNSMAMDGVNTEMLSGVFGPAYNFSVGGASLETNLIQLNEYLRNNAKPAKVLLMLGSAHTNYRNGNEVNPIIDYYYGDDFVVKNLKGIPLFKFRWLFIENFKKLLSANHRSAIVVNGQLRINSIVPDISSKKNKLDSCLQNDVYNAPGYSGMWSIIDVCKKAGITIEIFEMPCWKEVQNNCTDINISRKTGDSVYNLQINNLNNFNRCDTLLDPKKDWLSKNHLNYSGSSKVTREIIRMLANTISPVNPN